MSRPPMPDTYPEFYSWCITEAQEQECAPEFLMWQEITRARTQVADLERHILALADAALDALNGIACCSGRFPDRCSVCRARDKALQAKALEATQHVGGSTHAPPAPIHDDQCEAEFIDDAKAWTQCGCAKRAGAHAPEGTT